MNLLQQIESSYVLKDSKQDRQYNQIPSPYQKSLPSSFLWNDNNQNQPNSDILHKYQIREGKLLKKDLLKLIRIGSSILSLESNIIYIQEPLTIVGDIHGQYYDLHTIFKKKEFPIKNSKNQFVFLGDYVDRGHFSCEVMILLLALKIQFPENIYLLRGNHESIHCTNFYGFKEEVLRKYDQEVYYAFIECFKKLPIIAIINNKFIAMHGGIPFTTKSLQDANKINRMIEIPEQGFLCDILWSDPKENQIEKFQSNNQRGCSYFYNQQAVEEFLNYNNKDCIIRSHEVQQFGYKKQFLNKFNKPLIINIFSAPFYGKTCTNKGAIIDVYQNQFNFYEYSANLEEPFYYEFTNKSIKKYQNVFSWSLPFISEKITQIIVNLLSQTISYNDEQQAERQIQQYERKKSFIEKNIQKDDFFSHNKRVTIHGNRIPSIEQIQNYQNQSYENKNQQFQNLNRSPKKAIYGDNSNYNYQRQNTPNNYNEIKNTNYQLISQYSYESNKKYPIYQTKKYIQNNLSPIKYTRTEISQNNIEKYSTIDKASTYTNFYQQNQKQNIKNKNNIGMPINSNQQKIISKKKNKQQINQKFQLQQQKHNKIDNMLNENITKLDLEIIRLRQLKDNLAIFQKFNQETLHNLYQIQQSSRQSQNVDQINEKEFQRQVQQIRGSECRQSQTNQLQ